MGFFLSKHQVSWTPRVTADEAYEELMRSRANIQKNLQQINADFEALGYPADCVKVAIGSEIEMTEVAGEDAANNRLAWLLDQRRKGKLPDKDDSHMPEGARAHKLNEQFNPQGLGKRTRVAMELGWRDNLGQDEQLIEEDGLSKRKASPIALSQVEFISPPRTAVGTAIWIKGMMDMAVNGAKAVGLKRMETNALPSESTLPNSIHLTSSMLANGEDVLRATGDEAGKPSDLLLCIALEARDYMRHSIFLFARAENDYQRFDPKHIIGPTQNGILPRKESGNLGIGLLRGDGRKVQRRDSMNPELADSGPMRFELRVPCPGAAGHPNKTAYPEQEALAYEMVEAYTHILSNGVKRWRAREEARRAGEDVPELTEEMLRPGPEDTLPRLRETALKAFMDSADARAYWGSDRMDLLVRLSQDLDMLNELDTSPRQAEKGPHVNRR